MHCARGRTWGCTGECGMTLPQSLPMADHQSALHNCGPSPASVYRTAPAGTVYLLDLYGELHACPLIAKRLRARFTPLCTQDNNQRSLPNEAVVPPACPDAVRSLLSALLHLLEDPQRHGQMPRGRSASGTLRTAMRAFTRHGAGPSPSPCTEEEVLTSIVRLTQRLEQFGSLVPVSALVKWQPRTSINGASSVSSPTGIALPWMPEPPAPLRSAEMRALIRLAWIICVVSYAAPPIVLFGRAPSLRYWRADGMLSVRWLGNTEVVA